MVELRSMVVVGTRTRVGGESKEAGGDHCLVGETNRTTDAVVEHLQATAGSGSRSSDGIKGLRTKGVAGPEQLNDAIIHEERR